MVWLGIVSRAILCYLSSISLALSSRRRRRSYDSELASAELAPKVDQGWDAEEPNFQSALRERDCQAPKVLDKFAGSLMSPNGDWAALWIKVGGTLDRQPRRNQNDDEVVMVWGGHQIYYFY